MGFTITREEMDLFSRIADESIIVKANQRTFRTVHRITKIAPEKQNVFGWASVGYLRDGSEYTDWQGDVIRAVEDMEDAAYDFTLNSRDAGTMHIGKGGKGSLIESFVSTPEKWKAMGIPPGVLPTAWWCGFHINDPDAWDGVRKGRFKMFSVQGTGRRIPIL